MIYLLFISAGLFLGWLLGAGDASSLFGTAVGTKMVKFKLAAFISGIFLILGAVVQGEGGAETLSRLGSIDALGGAFTVALCAGLTVISLNYYNLPASTTHAIVGAIVGWCLFSKSGLDYATLRVIAASWISAPILGAIVAPLLYLLLRLVLQGSKTHIIKLDFHIRMSLLIAGAFSAYSLGANNIANVTGVFLHSFPAITLNLGVVILSGAQLLFLAGGLSIAAGIVLNGNKMTGVAAKKVMDLTPEAAIVVVLTHAIILFTFSSVTLSRLLHSIGLPFIPQVPVSSSLVVLGALFGISFLKGVCDVKINWMKTLFTSWILTPLIAMFSTFFSLFIVQNVFRIVVSGNEHSVETVAQPMPGGATEVINIPVSGNITLFIAAITIISGFALVVFFQLRKHRLIFHMQIEKGKIASQYNEMHQALTDIEIKTVQLENSALASRLQEKRNEVVNFALNISEQRKFLVMLAEKIELAYHEEETIKRKEVLMEALATLHQKMSFSHEMDNLYLKAEKVHDDFPAKVNEKFPTLTEQEKRLTILLRVGFSSKEISSIMNISPKSVEISRYRLRKKLNIDNKVNLTQYIKSI